MKSTKPKDRTVVVKFATPEPVSEDELQNIQTFADGVRQTARLVDTPTCFLNTHTYLEEVEAIAKAHPEVKLTVYKDEEVKEQGLTALWAVGKCAEFGPVFVLLEYSPKDAKGDFKLGLVGKGCARYLVEENPTTPCAELFTTLEAFNSSLEHPCAA
jgi:leucyl aminopeptidase